MDTFQCDRSDSEMTFAMSDSHFSPSVPSSPSSLSAAAAAAAVAVVAVTPSRRLLRAPCTPLRMPAVGADDRHRHTPAAQDSSSSNSDSAFGWNFDFGSEGRADENDGDLGFCHKRVRQSSVSVFFPPLTAVPPSATSSITGGSGSGSGCDGDRGESSSGFGAGMPSDWAQDDTRTNEELDIMFGADASHINPRAAFLAAHGSNTGLFPFSSSPSSSSSTAEVVFDNNNNNNNNNSSLCGLQVHEEQAKALRSRPHSAATMDQEP